MTIRGRENAIWAVLAVLGSGTIALLGLGSFGWNDYRNEALPAVSALVHGHLGGFFALAPVYGGSLLERAPFALVPILWGGGKLAVYRMLALPCLLAGGAFAVWLVARMRRDGQGRLQSVLVLGLCAANPVTLTALESGHPEELLGGVLSVAAVLLAGRVRPILAGLALGLAIANKQWALLAIGPVLIALPHRRMLCMSVAAAVGAALLAPFALSAPGAFGSAVSSAASPASAIFLPSQLWWFLGRPEHDGYRVAAGWIDPISHPLIVALGVPLTLTAWLVLRRSDRVVRTRLSRASADTHSRQAHALLLLALLLVLRFMLDPMDNAYYPLPFILALVAWEGLAQRRAPVFSAAVTGALWLGQHRVAPFASPDIQAAYFVAWSVPIAVFLGVKLYGPGVGVGQRGGVGLPARSLPARRIHRLKSDALLGD